jgi:hypothetical protein
MKKFLLDVVLDEHRHAMERATRALRTPFVIQRSSHGDGLRIQLNDRVKTGAVAVKSVNSLKEVVGESLRSERTRGHASLDLGHGKFRQRARSADRSSDAPRQASQRSCRQRCQAQAVEELSPVCHVVVLIDAEQGRFNWIGCVGCSNTFLSTASFRLQYCRYQTCSG